MLNLKKLFKKKPVQTTQAQQQSSTAADPIESARQLVNVVFYPKLEKDVKKLNEYLKEAHGVHVGIEITWFFEKIK